MTGKLRLILITLLILLPSATQGFSAEPLKIGVIRLLEHPDHLAMFEGFKKGLEMGGYEVTVLEEFNANSPGNPDTYVQKGQEAAKRMVSNGAQLIFSTAMYHAIKDVTGQVPIVDAAFLSPVIMKNAQEKDGKLYCTGKATGTYLSYPFKDISQFLRDSFKEEKTLAYIYKPGSPVSRPVEDISQAAAHFGFSVVPCPFNGKDDATAALEKAKKSAKIAFVTNDIAVIGAEKIALAFAQKSNYALVFGIIPLVNSGAFAGFQLNWKRAGEMCAAKTDKILKGADPQSIPIEKSDNYEFGLNTKTIEKLGIANIPYEWLEAATVLIQ